MPHGKYKNILYFISTVIIIILIIQVYWNYKNYQTGKQQLINEVQTDLDNAIDSYYIDLAERTTFGFSTTEEGNITKHPQFDSIINKLSSEGILSLDSLQRKFPEIDFTTGQRMEVKTTTSNKGDNSSSNNSHLMDSLRNSDRTDSINTTNHLAQKVIISITIDTLNTVLLNKHIEDQFQQKNLWFDYGYVFQNNSVAIQEYNVNLREGEVLNTQSKSAYLPKGSTFKFFFDNGSSTILKRNLLGISLSALLIFAVIACLLFLLKIINRQKQLSELKSDLINNITHEFKTPISTVKVALEGIEFFNDNNDPEKTSNYLQVSNTQLDKLQIMVEKLLETATLDGAELKLNKQKIDLVKIIFQLTEKHQNLAKHKLISVIAKEKEILVMADLFHLENALNNILDNAVKYGGDKINVNISSENENVKIKISDNGNSLTKTQASQIFDKFYRVPKGNTHDIKGFGIGLFYTKNIIEKHGGSITVTLNMQTSFIISLPKNA